MLYKSLKQHAEDVKAIQEHFKRISAEKISLQPAKNLQSNMTLERHYKEKTANLNINNLNAIISINKEYVHVEPKVTMDMLLKETLSENLVPYVLPEFKGITVGGAIMGASLESSSHAFGQFNDNCIEYEVLLDDGSVVIATPTENSDLFYALSSSYGTLGIILSAKIKLTRASKWVLLEYHHFTDNKKMLIALENFYSENTAPDYIEAIIFSKSHSVIITGKKVFTLLKQIKKNHLYCQKPWFYSHVEQATEKELVPLYDYLFRYDKGAFWMGSYLANWRSLWQYLTKVKDNKPLTTHQKVPSSILNEMVPLIFGKFLGSTNLYKALHAMPKGWFKNNFVVQDFYIPVEKALEFIEHAIETTQIFPLWVCPIKSTQSGQILAPHYTTEDSMLLDIGIYGAPRTDLGAIYHTKDLEKKAFMLNGRKMLYADTFYTKNEFWAIYQKSSYDFIRKTYHADKAFLPIDEKVLSL
ncbi:MAG: FAD-binding protein [Chlamydiales bacterium]|nr:FAD-binding protein [Chlamydiales bacterium]